MTLRSRPYSKLNSQLVRYHQADLLIQISQLKDQIETNLAKHESIKHLKDLILERELYLTECLGAAKPAHQQAGSRPSITTPYGPNWRRE